MVIQKLYEYGGKIILNRIHRIKWLIKVLNNASNLYYNSTPIMTDYEWDKLYDELKVLEKEETCNTKINELEVQIKDLIEENKQISDKNDKLQQENAELKAALEQLAKTIKENQDGQM